MRSQFAKLNKKMFRCYKNAVPPRAYIASDDLANVLATAMVAEDIEERWEEWLLLGQGEEAYDQSIETLREYFLQTERDYWHFQKIYADGKMDA